MDRVKRWTLIATIMGSSIAFIDHILAVSELYVRLREKERDGVLDVGA